MQVNTLLLTMLSLVNFIKKNSSAVWWKRMYFAAVISYNRHSAQARFHLLLHNSQHKVRRKMCFATSCKLFRTLENCKNIGDYG